MKQNYCKDSCPKYDHDNSRCKHTKADNCHYLKVDLNRITNPRRKHRIDIVFQSNMDRVETIIYDNRVYGAFQGE
jgi:hypothetical protein